VISLAARRVGSIVGVLVVDLLTQLNRCF